MLLLAEIVLFVAGIVFMARRGIRLGEYVLGRPHTVFIGLVFFLVLPVALLGVFMFGFGKGIKYARTGLPLDEKKLVAQATYVELAIIGGALASGVGIAVAGTRRYEVEYLPPEEVSGVRNYAAEQEHAKLESRVREAARNVR